MHLVAAEPDPVAPYPPQPPRLLNRVRDKLRLKRYSIRAACARAAWWSRPGRVGAKERIKGRPSCTSSTRTNRSRAGEYAVLVGNW